jgi:hypothetical protein
LLHLALVTPEARLRDSKSPLAQYLSSNAQPSEAIPDSLRGRALPLRPFLSVFCLSTYETVKGSDDKGNAEPAVHDFPPNKVRAGAQALSALSLRVFK